MNRKTFEINGIDELSRVSDHLISLREKSSVFAFFGSMGAGKTTLIKNLCHKLEVADEVTSPTFAIINEYRTNAGESIYHFDFYRIKKIEEVFDIGYENYLYSGNLCLLEWPEMIESLMPDQYVRIDIQIGSSDESRIISCEIVQSV